jgi:aldehyde:ferredoxin oxidoreductase
MGSKNLKAVAIRGTHSISVADLNTVQRIANEMFDKVYADPSLKVWHDYGLGSVVPWANSIGALPTRNFQSGSFESVKDIDHESMRAKITVGSKGCFGCPMCCGKFSHVKSRNVYVEGPEYETSALIGSNCGLDNIEDVAYGNYLCDELGLDTISAGNVVAFTMECFEKGIVDASQTDGLVLRFGDIEAFEALVRKIAAREGVGDLLAEGVRTTSQTWGKGSDKFAIQVKGLEWSGYESRGAPAMMLSYITCDVGSHHNRSWAITYDIAEGREKIEGKAQKVIELQHVRPLLDCLGVCRLQWVEMGLSLDYYAQLYPAVTGIQTRWDEMLGYCERIYNLTRAFAARELDDFGRSYDYPPKRFQEEPIPTGATSGSKIQRSDIDQLLDEYYRLRGWDANGIPTAETLRRLGLPEVIADISAA